MRVTGDFVIFGVAVGFNVILCLLLSRWYVWPALDARPRREALILALWPHTNRVLNLAAATVGQVHPSVPRAWTMEIAWGDFAAAVLALLSIAALRKNSSAGFTLAWITSVFGLLDFANSFGQGLLYDATNLPLRAVWYIAVGVVPPLAIAHLLAIRLLLKRD